MENHVLPGFMREDYDRAVVRMRFEGEMGNLEPPADPQTEERFSTALVALSERHDHVVFGLLENEIPLPRFFGNFDGNF